MPQPDKLITSIWKEKFAAAPAVIAPWLQVPPEALFVHDQVDDPVSPSMSVPAGSVSVAVSGPVPALPVSDTSTVTTAVTPRLSRLPTFTPTASFAATATGVPLVGVGVGVGVGPGPVVGELLGRTGGEVEGDGPGLADLCGGFGCLGSPGPLRSALRMVPATLTDLGWPTVRSSPGTPACGAGLWVREIVSGGARSLAGDSGGGEPASAPRSRPPPRRR